VEKSRGTSKPDKQMIGMIRTNGQVGRWFERENIRWEKYIIIKKFLKKSKSCSSGRKRRTRDNETDEEERS